MVSGILTRLKSNRKRKGLNEEKDTSKKYSDAFINKIFKRIWKELE